MEKMKMDSPLDFAVFQLSPKRSRCELFVSGGGSTEKLASGLLKPFIAHLKIAEEQVASAAQSVKLEVGRRKNAESWFTKGTLERFVRFVSTPEILELVNTFDAEMSQLEAARRIYSQGAGDQLSGGSGSGATTADDATKKELLRAIDLRLAAVQQDLSSTCARADAAGFNVDTVSELQMFADSFGAHRLNEACGKFITVSERRPNLIRKPGSESRTVRSSCGSDMSIDDVVSPPTQNPATCHQSDPPPVTFPLRRASSRESSVEERDDGNNKWNDAFGEKEAKDDNPIPDQTRSTQTSHHVRRLSVQDRISLFENKQKENSGGKPVELRRLSSDVSAMGAAAAEKAVLRRWSGASDMSIDLGVEKKDVDDTVKSSSVVKAEIKVIPGLIRNNSENNFTEFTKSNCDAVSGGRSGLHDRMLSSKTQSRSSSISRSENQENSEERLNVFRGENVSDFLHGSQGKDQDFSLEKFTSIGNKGVREDSESTVETVEQTSLKSNRKNTGESGSRIREAFAARYKGIDNDSSSARRDVKSIEETEVVEKKELRSFEKVSSGSVSEVEDSGPRRMKFNRKANANGKSMTSFSGEIRAEAEEEVLDSFSTPPPEQAQRAKRQSKGNQELNDELKMKANELEKLFAEHKLRAPGDQSNFKSNEPSGSSKNKTKSNDAPSSLMKAIDSKNYGDALKKSFSELSVSEGSRGKSYDMYIRKRDAKLKEDWSANRAEKEARLKSMQDSLERNRSEMKAKFSGSAHGSVSSSRRRAERLRSYNSRSIMNSEQQNLGFGDSDDDEEASESIEKNYPREDRAFDDSSAQGKKLLPNNRNLSSSILPRTSAAPVPRSATKTTNNSMKRRAQPENPLAQSVPNFSDLRKENTKPSVGSSKATRSQVRNYVRSKSTSEEAVTAKEDKSRRLQVVRKSSANPSESREMSPQDSDGVILTTIKFDEEVVTKNAGTKPFLKKGSRARTSVARYKSSSLGSEPVRNVEENDDVAYAPDEAVESIVVKDEVDEEFEPSNTEDGSKILEAEEPIPIENSGSEDGDDVTLGFSRVDQALGSQLPSESPISWNSHGQQHPYSYPHEMSDIDASVDSPVGSPLWSSHSLKQMEADRMRKKWGTAQKPTLIAAAAAHSLNNSSRKDMTRGFKRLLKFGRKSRGSENLVDWISATTSEGDDDTEDGRDIANRSSEDLRKSRMGFSQAQPLDYSFNESEFFNESVRSSLSSIPAPPPDFELREDHISGTSIKAPRSFFSLSTFRSKGSESKPR